jgi:hypothetical protein
MLLLGIAVAAILIGGLRLLTEQPRLPAGSSSSAQPDGALGLYTWMSDLGARVQRRNDTFIDPGASTVLLIQPAAIVDEGIRDSLQEVATRGGTIVLAGDSVQWLLLARALGVDVQPASAPASAATATTNDGSTVPFVSRYRLGPNTAGAQPLLVGANGDWVGVRQPLGQGNLIVITSPEPFTNAGLSDDTTARFVFREIVSPALAADGPALFDELGRPATGVPEASVGVDQLLFQTPPGRALLYASVLTFVFLLLAGRRPGPPVYLRSAVETPRTMYEHVQMLANLYRRAGQWKVVREAFRRQYARALARGTHDPGRARALREALVRLDSARSEAEVVAAVGSIEDGR